MTRICTDFAGHSVLLIFSNEIAQLQGNDLIAVPDADILLPKNPHTYSCNSYMILGDMNRVGDVNVLIDPDTDDFVIQEIERFSAGFGKSPVDRVYLTHNHFDHAASVGILKKRYGAKVFAFNRMAEMDELLRDGQTYPAGDDHLEVVHTPGHSSDSVCFYNKTHQALFSGDTPLEVRNAGDSYMQEYLDSLCRLSAKPIQTVYPGHHVLLTHQIVEILMETIGNIRQSQSLSTYLNK